jgi:small subunit ribosomal protein S14
LCRCRIAWGKGALLNAYPASHRVSGNSRCQQANKSTAAKQVNRQPSSATTIMSLFRAKKLDISSFINAKVIRDHTKRKVFNENETQRYGLKRCLAFHGTLTYADNNDRQALRYMMRNTTLPQRTRVQAQLDLSKMHAYTRLTQLRNRCIMGGKSRGVSRAFRMARVGRHGDQIKQRETKI